MLTATLRRSGGSLIMTIPSAYAEQNRLDAGSCVSVDIVGAPLRFARGANVGRFRNCLQQLRLSAHE